MLSLRRSLCIECRRELDTQEGIPIKRDAYACSDRTTCHADRFLKIQAQKARLLDERPFGLVEATSNGQGCVYDGCVAVGVALCMW